MFRSPKKPDQQYIRDMFNDLAGRYDTFTWLVGFGQAKSLRKKTLEGIKPGMRVLDLGCGTADLALAAAKMASPNGEVVGLDLSKQMLGIAKQKAEKIKSPLAKLYWKEARAEDLPMNGEFFDRIVSGFVLRNLYENIAVILQGVRRSLKPEGRIRFLDLTRPENPVLASVFYFYMTTLVGLYGTLLFGRKYPVAYLPDSAARFFTAKGFVEELKKAGFRNITARSFILGSVTLYEAEK